MEESVLKVGKWRDDLIWCPSQCYLPIDYNGTAYMLYLRWRWSNPWAATLLKNYDTEEEEWIRLEIPYFTDEQLSECKTAAFHSAIDKLINFNV